MDMLQITALNVKTKIGIHAWEQRILQQLLIDIHIDADFSACKDELTNTLDYDALCQLVTTYVEGNTFKLIETVAEHVAGLIKEKFAVKQVKISVSKPHAVKNAGNVCIIINR
jgi:7,8-dihydroneopterin aldolase/epimerase/oxygenase